MKRNWSIREAIPEAAEQELKEYSKLLRHLLFYRGVGTAEEAERFLNPSYERDLHDPFLLKDMERAVIRLVDVVRSNQKTVIFADYDADGVPGAAVLTEFFRAVGFTNFTVYIPDRHEEAYGLSPEAVRQFAAAGVKLILTIDCGITDVAEIKLANELGLAVIITDHHLPPAGGLPPAFAILNPKQPGDIYPEKMLCGAGVVFKLVQGLVRRGDFALNENFEKWLLDLVAVATLSDMVPLTGENRALAYFGLKVLRQTKRLGLQALFAVLRLDRNFISVDDITYLIGPRLNAASRMTHASEAYYLLTTLDPVESGRLARHLDGKNQERRQLVDVVLAAVDSSPLEVLSAPLLVLGAPDWSLGLLGLAASRLVEKYQRPVFLWGANSNGEVKGSCRSDGSVNIVELMAAAGGQELFSDFGGHAAAGGFSLSPRRVEELAPRLISAYRAIAKTEQNASLMIDTVLPLSEVNGDTMQLIETLSPCGIGNPKPLFLFPGVRVSQVRSFGNGGLHRELLLERSSGETIKAISFFGGAGGSPPAGETIDLVASLEKSYFRQPPELRLRLADWRPLC